MQSLALAIAVSTMLGFLSGLGVGGGSLLILWLTGPLLFIGICSNCFCLYTSAPVFR